MQLLDLTRETEGSRLKKWTVPNWDRRPEIGGDLIKLMI
jgi:hypothetical protein